MNTKLKKIIALALVMWSAAFSVHGLIPDDADGDGVPDAVDLCPGENSSFFDRNADGCIDDFVGGRHVEYWSSEDATIGYVINELGVPAITNGSDITAVQNAVNTWMNVDDTNLNVVYGGLSPLTNSNGLDRVNLVTFVDDAFPFSPLVLAVGLSTSFEADTVIAGRVFKKGEIFDADMVFNPAKTFQVGGGGPGIDIQSVATHEAGHLFGISHSAIQSSTMFYVLPGGLAARTLEDDDERVYFKAYGTESALATSNRIDVTVHDGQTDDPVPGAIVFVINSATNDTAACDYTLANGAATFPGLAPGSYYVSIHPLNGTSPIGFIAPGNINFLIAAIATENFVPESFDGDESNQDDPTARTPVTVGFSGPVATVAIITNIDATGPTVISTSPGEGNDTDIDSAYRIQFSEAIEVSTLGAAFSFRDDATSTPHTGSLAVLKDDSVVVFIPSPPLAFATDYTLAFDSDLEDKFGNPLVSEFQLHVTTEPEPPVSITSLAPSKGVIGATFVINGQGFEPGATVSFAGLPASVASITEHRIVASVPAGAVTGLVVVTNTDLSQSNPLTFTVLTQAEVARGFESGQAELGSTPHAVAVTPSGDYSYVATDDGAEAIVTDPASTGYLTSTSIQFSGGFDDIAVNPAGTRAYAVSGAGATFVEINADPTAGLLFNTILSTRPVGARPRGIVIDPTGDRAYVSTDEAEVQVWDIRLGSASYRQQIGAIASPSGSGVEAALATTPSGDRVLFATEDGTVAFYNPATQTVVNTVSAGIGVRSILVDPLGQRAYVTHDDGDISVLNIEAAPFEVQDIETGGSLRGISITPGASYLYATNRALDNLPVVDLVLNNATFRSVVAEIPASADPTDIAISPDGVYALSVLQGDAVDGIAPRLLVSTIGIGPTLAHIHPIAGPIGTTVVLRATELSENPARTAVNFNGIVVSGVGSGLANEIVVAVPAGATSGPVTIEVEQGDGSLRTSNAVHFEVLAPSSGGLRYAATLEPGFSTGEQMQDDIAMSPKGDVLFTRFDSQVVKAYDIRPSSTDFHREIASFSLGQTIVDISVTADGKTGLMYASGSGGGNVVRAFVADPNHPDFAKLRPITLSGFGAGGGFIRTSPNNVHALVYDNEVNNLVLIDATDVSLDVNPNIVQIQEPAGGPMDAVFHPSGRAAYITNGVASGVQVISTDPRSPSYGFNIGFVSVPTAGIPATSAISVSPDGNTVYVYTIETGPGTPRQLHTYSVNPASEYQLTYVGSAALGAEIPASFLPRNLVISPRGDRGIRSSVTGFNLFDVTAPVSPILPVIGTAENAGLSDFAFTPDGLHMYVASEPYDHIRQYDFATAAAISIVSGNNQTGVAGENLAAPIRVRVVGSAAGPPVGVAGIPVTFTGDATSGFFEIPCEFGTCLRNEIIVPTDANGFAQAIWHLFDVGVHTVTVTTEDVPGSPLTFTATVVADPSTLPLTVAEVIPLHNSTDVSVSTTALVTFSRAIDPSTIDATSLFIQTAVDATKVPVALGFTDDDRRVSLTPLSPLSTSTDYEIITTAAIQNDDGDPLTNPGTTSFETQAPPPLAITSIYPPSALPGTQVLIAGTSFANGTNTVNFGTQQVVVQGTSVALLARVPNTAPVGALTVSVNNGTTTSSVVPFTVLERGTIPIDEVVATITSGTAIKSVAVTGDGALAYNVSPEGDVVVPVDVAGASTFPSIPVGDQPVAIVIDPASKFAYVANFNSGNVSVIDVDPASLTFNTVVSNIAVGRNPLDLAVFPDGDRVLVANAGSSSVSVIDSDASSASYRQVTATINQGTATKSVAVSGDGAIIYIGTDLGITVVTATGYEVSATINTGSAVKSVAVGPDGTLLFALTTAGDVLIIDVSDGSPTENQVTATINQGTATKSVAVSGDGTLLYLIPEVGDLVTVIALDIIPGVSALDPDAASAFTVEWHVVTTLHAGDDPSDIAIDPSGSGRLFVVNQGDKSLSIFGEPIVAAEASFDIVPNIIIPKLPGFYILGVIQLAGPLSVHDIDISSVRVFDTVHVAPGKFFIGDVNHDDVDDLSVLFCRDEFLAAMPENGEHVTVPLDGVVAGDDFEGSDDIRVLRPTIHQPEDHERVISGEPYTFRWTTPLQILPCDEVKIEWRHDGDDPDDIDCDFPFVAGDDDNAQGAFEPGPDELERVRRLDEKAEVADADWILIANHVANDGDFTWNVPTGYFPNARLRITLLWFGFKVGSSEVPFTIEMPVPVRLKSFDVTMDDGAALLRWETSMEVGMQGYEIVRAEQERGRYDAVTKEMVPSSGSTSGGSYEYRDETVAANRTYWYKLREVSDDGLGAEYGPYSVTYRVTNRLDQNVPNPFNPTTTIAYAIASDNQVSLTIYDVAGRKVRTLVNERQKADMYKLTWDGVNDAGSRVASGVYFYKLVAGKFTQTKKMVLLK